MQSSFPQLVSVQPVAYKASKGHQPEWGSQLSHLWCGYCSVTVMCSNLCHVLWNGEGNHGEKI